MGSASAIVKCIWCLSILRTSQLSTCWEMGSQRICSTTTVWDARGTWLYEHDVTTLFAGLASQARRRFGIAAKQLHIDTTSFAVSGDYASQEEGTPAPIAIPYGYSRDHREDLKQWMLA